MGFFLTETITNPTAEPPARRPGSVAKTSIGAPFWHTILSSKYWDSDTKLLYYGHRYNSPSMGRWFSRDPIAESGFEIANNASSEGYRVSFQGLDTDVYSFVGNEPVGKADVLGLGWNDPPPCAPYPDCMGGGGGGGGGNGGGSGGGIRIRFRCPGYSKCCSQSVCLAAVEQRWKDCVSVGEAACVAGCAITCKFVRNPFCGQVCYAGCTLAIMTGCTAGAGICTAFCASCPLP